MATLTRILAESYRVADAVLEVAPGGHSNETFFVRTAAQELVLRRSFAGKTQEAVAREEAVLTALARLAPALPLPRLLPTVQGALHAVEAAADGPRALHLFERLRGTPHDPMRGPCSARRARAALGTLARLHRALARVAQLGDGDPVEWLKARRDRVARRTTARLPRDVTEVLPHLWPRIDALLERARELAGTPPIQWLHGDYHPGNLLFAGDDVTGVVDFDEPGRGAPAIEVGLALFTVSRDARSDGELRFDPTLWDEGLAAYREAGGPCAPSPEARDQYLALFCIDQVLIHLEACQRGLWSLGPGIGFLPCWRSMLSWIDPS